MVMAILLPLFWVSATSNTCTAANSQNISKKIILSGVFWMDKNCQGEACQKMSFEFYLTSDGVAVLRFYDYYSKETSLKTSQVPLTMIKNIQKALQKNWPKVELGSNGMDATFSPFDCKKNKLLETSQKIMDDIWKAMPRTKVDIQFYSSQ